MLYVRFDHVAFNKTHAQNYWRWKSKWAKKMWFLFWSNTKSYLTSSKERRKGKKILLAECDAVAMKKFKPVSTLIHAYILINTLKQNQHHAVATKTAPATASMTALTQQQFIGEFDLWTKEIIIKTTNKPNDGWKMRRTRSIKSKILCWMDSFCRVCQKSNRVYDNYHLIRA